MRSGRDESRCHCKSVDVIQGDGQECIYREKSTRNPNESVCMLNITFVKPFCQVEHVPVSSTDALELHGAVRGKILEQKHFKRFIPTG